MKKLMIAAAIVCAAAISQAAAITWGTGKVNTVDADGAWTGNSAYNKSGSSVVSLTITAYLYDATGANILGSTTLTGTGDQLFTSKSSAISNQSFLDGEGQVVEVANATKYMASIVMSGDFGNGGTQDFLATDKFEFTSAGNGETSLKFDTDPKILNVTAGTVQWTEAVPEPTSGLLLLLGVAGLALRRRRA